MMINKIMENWQKMAEIQRETLTQVYKDMTEKSVSNVDTNEIVKNIFTNPFEVFNTFTKASESTLKNSKEILENNMKYHKAFIAYHEAMKDMMDAVTSNIKIISGEKK
jgi:hypothetical protein